MAAAKKEGIMALEEQWLRLIILVSLLWLARQLWAHAVAWVLPRGRCPWPRRLRSGTPQDCPACQQTTNAAATAAPTLAVPPWRSAQCRRGRPQTIPTAGYACPNQPAGPGRATGHDSPSTRAQRERGPMGKAAQAWGQPRRRLLQSPTP